MTESITRRAPLPFADLLLELGATMGPLEGAERPLDYGDPAGEHEALVSGCGLLPRSWAGRLDVTGADRARFVHGLVTSEIRGLGPGEGSYGFFTDVKGKVLADVAARAETDRLALELPPGAWRDGLEEHVHRYLIADRVDFVPVDGRLVVTLAGPQADVALAALGVQPPPEPWGHAETRLAGHDGVVWRRRLDGEVVFDLEVPAEVAPRLVEALRPVARPVGEVAWQTRRVERLAPRFGVDFGPDHFPQESGVEEAINFTKGCYLGQEVVARIHYRGKVNRSLRGLRFPGGAPAAGTSVVHDSKEMGRVTSVAVSPTVGGSIGLALLHRRVAEPGTEVELDDGTRATVVDRFL